MNNCLPIPVLSHGDPGHRGKGRWLLWLLQAGQGRCGFLGPSGWSQLGYIYRGDESPWSDKTSCSTTVWVLAWWYSCCTTSGRLSCILEERNLTRRLRIYGPKINRSRKAAKRLARRTRTRCWSVMVVFL